MKSSWTTLLCTIKYLPLSDESMDVDPNYDPSDFLMQGLPSRENRLQTGKIHDDLAVSESDEEPPNTDGNIKVEDNDNNDIDAGELWF